MVAPDHPLTQLTGPRVQHLADYPAILPSSATYTHAIVRAAFERLQARLQIRLETNYLETIRMMVSIGLGWSTLPCTMRNAEVVTLPLPELELHRTLGAVYHQDRTLSHAAEALLSLLPTV